MKTIKRDKTGMVLVIVLSIALCLALLGLGMLQLGLGSRIMAAREVANISARCAADSGLTHALYSMNNLFVIGDPSNFEPPPDVIDRILKNMNATYSYQIEDQLTHPVTGKPYWLVESVGKMGSQQRTVYAMLGYRNLFDYGLIVTDKITLKSNTLVDGYDRSLGPYVYEESPPYTNSHRHVRIGTTSIVEDSVWLGSDTEITGDILVGIGGEVHNIITNPSGNAIIGNCYNLPEPVLFPQIIPPSDYDIAMVLIGSDLSIEAPPGYTIENPYTVLAESISIGQGGSLTVVGNVAICVTGDMSFDQGAFLNVGDGTVISSLDIYLHGDLLGRQAGGINNLSQIPGYFKLLGTGEPYQQWDIHNSLEFHGVYYGPNADIIIRADADIFGSVSGHSYDMKNSGFLHYDISLRDLSKYNTGFGIDRWWEKSDFIAAE